MNFNALFLLALFSFLIKVSKEKETTEFLQCFLKGNESKCSLDKEDASWKRLSELVHSLPIATRDIISKNNLNFNSKDEILPLFPVLFHLVPVEKLSTISGTLAGSLLHMFNNDTALASKLLSALRTVVQRRQFLKALSGTKLSNDVQMELSKEVAKWSYDEDWNEFFLQSLGNPLLVYLPTEFLFNLSSDYAAKYLFYLKSFGDNTEIRDNDDVRNATDIWSQYPPLIKRTWLRLIIEQNYPVPLSNWNYNSFNKLNFVILGMNIEELGRLDVTTELSQKQVLSFGWNHIQLRSLFDKITDGNHVYRLAVENLQKNLFKFLPRHLQQLPATHFYKIRDIVTRSKTFDSLSLSSGLQMFEYMLAVNEGNNSASRIQTDNFSSDLSIYKLLYLKSPTYLIEFCKNELPLQTLVDIDSMKFTQTQAYYITACIVKFKSSLSNLMAVQGLLKSIPSSYFIEVPSNIISSNILSHLLSNLDNENVPLSATTIQFIRPNFAKYFLLDLLLNENNEIWSLISPLEVVLCSRQIRNIMSNSEQKGLANRIQRLPRHILAPLLYKKGDLVWEDLYRTDQLNLVIGGLTCDILSKIPPTDFIPIFSLYNRQRSLFNQVFPKDLQRCVQMSVISYLKLKASLYENGSDYENLISYLDISDIKAIGGYILATLPVKTIFESNFSDDILREIGKLSLPELMLAMNKQHFESITATYISRSEHGIIGLKQLLLLKNLIHFIPSSYLLSIEKDAFKFILESEYIDTRICANTESRQTWAKLIHRTFGESKSWKSDTLIMLNDMLISLPTSDVKSVDSAEWLNVADLLKSQYDNSIQWYDKSLPFYKICMSTMNVEEAEEYLTEISKLMMYYLIAIQNQLSTIIYKPDLLEQDEFGKILAENRFHIKNYENDLPKIKLGIPMVDNYSGALNEEHIAIDDNVNKTTDHNIDKTIDHYIVSVVDQTKINRITKPTTVKNSEHTSEMIMVNGAENIAHAMPQFTTTYLNQDLSSENLYDTIMEANPLEMTQTSTLHIDLDMMDQPTTTHLGLVAISENSYISTVYDKPENFDHVTLSSPLNENPSDIRGTIQSTSYKLNKRVTTSIPELQTNTSNESEHTPKESVATDRLTTVDTVENITKEFDPETTTKFDLKILFPIFWFTDDKRNATQNIYEETTPSHGLEWKDVDNHTGISTDKLLEGELSTVIHEYDHGLKNDAVENSKYTTITEIKAHTIGVDVSEQSKYNETKFTTEFDSKMSTEFDTVTLKSEAWNSTLLDRNTFSSYTALMKNESPSESNKLMEPVITVRNSLSESTTEYNNLSSENEYGNQNVTTYVENISATSANILTSTFIILETNTTKDFTHNVLDWPDSTNEQFKYVVKKPTILVMENTTDLNIHNGTNTEISNNQVAVSTTHSQISVTLANDSSPSPVVRTILHNHIADTGIMNVTLASVNKFTDDTAEKHGAVTGLSDYIITTDILNHGSTENNLGKSSTGVSKYANTTKYINSTTPSVELFTNEFVTLSTNIESAKTNNTSAEVGPTEIKIPTSAESKVYSTEVKQLLHFDFITYPTAEPVENLPHTNERSRNKPVVSFTETYDVLQNSSPKNNLYHDLGKIQNYTNSDRNHENISKIHRKREQNIQNDYYRDSEGEKENNFVRLLDNNIQSDHIGLEIKIPKKKIKHDITDKQIFELLKLLNITEIQPIKPKKKSCRGRKNIKKTHRGKRSIINIFNPEIRVSCDAMRSLGTVSKLAFRYMNLSLMRDEDIFNCLELFGKMDLTQDDKIIIWNAIKEKKLYHVLGSVINAVTVNELNYFNFSIKSDWGLEILHLFSQHTESTSLHEEIINKFLRENKEYVSKKLLLPAVVSLGHLVCYLPSSMLQNIFSDKTSISQLWTVLHGIKGCPMKCLSKLASIAVDKIGQPNTWSSFEYYTLGPVPSGIEENLWHSLVHSNFNFTTSLSPLAVQCLSPNMTKMLTEDHLSGLSPVAASALTFQQKKLFSKSQMKVINDLLSMEINNALLTFKKTSVSKSSSNSLALSFTFLSVIAATWLVYYM